MPFLKSSADGSLRLSLYVQPRASRPGFTGLHGTALRLAIAAPPVDGRANKEVIAYLADFFKIPRKQITLVGGLQSRSKTCRISGLSEEQARALLAGVAAKKD